MNSFNLVKSHLKDKKNSLLFLVLTFVLIAIFAILSVHYFFSYGTSKELIATRNREITIEEELNDEQINKIKTIKHVSSLTESVYNTSISSSYFEKDGLQSDITLIPLLEDNEIKIVNGHKIKNNYEIICPIDFYPYDISEKIIEDNYLKGKKLIGTSFEAVSQNGISNKYTIVGTYNTKKTTNDKNACYANYETMRSLNSNDEEKQKSYVVRVDSLKKVTEVNKQIRDLNINTYRPNFYYEYDYTSNNALKLISLFATVVILMVCYIVIYNFIRKKIHYNLSKYGILDAIGYKKKTIIIIELVENLLISLFATIPSFLIYAITHYYVIRQIDDYLLYDFSNELDLQIPYQYILLSLIFVIVMIILSTIILLKYNLKNNANKLLRNDPK